MEPGGLNELDVNAFDELVVVGTADVTTEVEIEVGALDELGETVVGTADGGSVKADELELLSIAALEVIEVDTTEETRLADDEMTLLDRVWYRFVKTRLQAPNPVPLGNHTNSEFASSILKQPFESN